MYIFYVHWIAKQDHLVYLHLIKQDTQLSQRDRAAGCTSFS